MVSCENIAKHENNTIRVTDILFINITQLIKLEFVLQQYDFVFVLSLDRALTVGIITVV